MTTPFQPNLTSDQFVAYMHAAIEFIPPEGPDAVQWQLIKDMTARTSLEPARTAAPAPKRCNCGSHT